MSRRNKTSSSNKNDKDNKGPPPSYPSEHLKDHRIFLVRSLQRNDVDMAALMELNETIHKTKEKILQSCGELVLLDLGCGRLTLVNDELHEETALKGRNSGSDETEEPQHHLTPAQKEICVDFLLRMKLRRKLSNRLIRRLNRVATAMDGKDVAPPAPPRYGDLRLHIEPKEVVARIQEWKRRDEAKQRILAFLNGDTEVYNSKASSKGSQEDALDKGVDKATTDDKNNVEGENVAASTASGTPADDSANKVHHQGETKETTDESEAKDDTTKAEKEVTALKKEDELEQKQKDTNMPSGVQDEAKPMEVKETSDEKPTESEIQETPEVERTSPDNAQSFETPSIDNPTDTVYIPTMESDYELLKEYETAFEKVWDPKSKLFRYILADEEAGEPEYTQIKHGLGIGATARIMTSQDREVEHKRWQTNMLARIPNQPTFEELGLKNRVFNLEARRKRCLEEAAEDDEDVDDEGNAKRSKVEDDTSATVKPQVRERVGGKELRKIPKEETAGSDEDEEVVKMDVSAQSEPDEKQETLGTDEDDTEADVEMKNEIAEGKTDENENREDSVKGEVKSTESNDEELHNEKNADREEVGNEPIQPKRPISLAAVPSFHEQDMMRLKLIHTDLMRYAMLEQRRSRLAEVTNEYNNALRTSNALLQEQHDIQHSLTFVIARGRQELSRVTSGHMAEFAAAKQRWMKEKHDYDMKRIQTVLPSRWGKHPHGTQAIRHFMNKLGNNIDQVMVGLCLADVVDGSIMVGEGKVTMHPFREFTPPPSPGFDAQTGEDMAQRQHRVESEYRAKYNHVSSKMSTSEAERARAWRKMLKTKAELGIPHEHIDGSYKREIRLDHNNYHAIPVPAIRTAAQNTGSRELDRHRNAVASYVPPATGESESKYSAAKIKARKAADGTIAPVSEPKKTSEGLYMRPAGRTRKGMRWDPVAGVWVPQDS